METIDVEGVQVRFRTGAMRVQQDAAEIVDIYEEKNLCTFSTILGDQDGVDAWAVGVYPELTERHDGGLTRQQVLEFLYKIAPYINQGLLYCLSARYDQGKGQSVLRVVKLVVNVKEAIRIGYRNDQDVIYHLGTGQAIYL